MTEYTCDGIPDTPLGRYVRLVKPMRIEPPLTRAGKAQTVYPSEVKAKAVALYKAGKSIEQVANEVGANDWSVKRWLRLAGVGPKRRRHSPEQKAEALRLTDEGMSAPEVSKRLGIPRDTIHFWRHVR